MSNLLPIKLVENQNNTFSRREQLGYQGAYILYDRIIPCIREVLYKINST